MIKAYRKFSQVVTLQKAYEKEGRYLKPEDLSIIRNGSLVFDEQNILWVGKDEELPSHLEKKIVETKNFPETIVLPEIVDSHTHAVFGGDRAFEYAMRLNGATYEELAKAGGGILHTMGKTNLLSRDELYQLAKGRIEAIANYGVGTIEIKSGYGLTYEKEKELSLIIDDLKKYFKNKKIQIINTYMAAHAVPTEFNSSSQYLDQVVLPLLDELAPLKIIDAVDVFHEKGYFTSNDVYHLANRAKKHQMQFKIHADEFNDNGGLKLALDLNASSADHLLASHHETISQMGKFSTVATLLPGTGFFLGKKMANGRSFLDAGAKVAIASDYNPGSCHCDNLLLLAFISAPLYKMNQAELWASITLNASHALGLKNQGVLKENFAARFSLFDVPTIDHLSYHWGKNFFKKLSS